MLSKLSSYGITGRVFSVIKYFSEIAVNDKTSETLRINVGVLLRPTVFLFCLNDLVNNILRSFVNIYSDETRAYRCPSKINAEQRLTVVFSSNLALTY